MALFNIFKKKKEEAGPEEQVSRQQELNEGLKKTKEGIFGKLARAVAGRSQVDEAMLDDLEEVLITSDVGVDTTVKIIRNIEARVARDKYMNSGELKSILREEISALLQQSDSRRDSFGLDVKEGAPYVVMVVGVNGVGKTTTIGKLAAQLVRAGKKVYIGAADTFRAAAIDQLQVWADDDKTGDGGGPRFRSFRYAQVGRCQRGGCRIDRYGRPAAQQGRSDE